MLINVSLTCVHLYIGSTSLGYSYFGDGPSPHILSNIGCSGTRNTLLDCSFSAPNAVVSCGDNEAASVICLGKEFLRSCCLAKYYCRGLY